MNDLRITQTVFKEEDTSTIGITLLKDRKPFELLETDIVEVYVANLENVVVLQRELPIINGKIELVLADELPKDYYQMEVMLTRDGEVETFPTKGYASFELERNIKNLPEGKIEKSQYEILIDRLDEIEKNGVGGGTEDYVGLINKPTINDIVLEGNKTGAELGLADQSVLDDVAKALEEILNGTSNSPYITQNDLNLALNNKTDLNHTHDEFALKTDLNAKADVDHNHDEFGNIQEALESILGGGATSVYVTEEEFEARLGDIALILDKVNGKEV